jgi:hypothetical protein
MRKLVTIAVVLGILGLSGLATAQESTDGVIDGQVINGTAGGENVSGLDVTLLLMVLGFEGDIELQKQRLLQEIAQLDDEFEQGAIDENIFRQRRLEKKSLLLEMIRRGKEKGKSSG